MSLTSLLRDPQSPVRTYLDNISPLLKASGGGGDGSHAAAAALGLPQLARNRTLVPAFPGVDPSLSGSALDFRTRIALGGFDPDGSMAAAGIAQLTNLTHLVENGPHRTKVLTEAFGVAKMLLRTPFTDSDLDRASILLAYCEQVARAGIEVMKGSVGLSCDAATDGESFANQLVEVALEDIRSLMVSNAGQLEAWQNQISDGDRYEPNPGFSGAEHVGGADADWVIGETLFDCKVYGALTVPKLRDFVRQLLGYVMLDSDDSLSIRHVGIWLPRQELTQGWSLELLLGGDPEELLPPLRQGFIKATNKTQVSSYSPISTRRKHLLLAENRHTPFTMLAELALGEDIGIRRRIGRNAVAPEATVRMLARDPRWEVREGVALNEAAPEDVLDALSRDRSSAVRRAVADHRGAPLPPAKVVVAGKHDDLRQAALTNAGMENALTVGEARGDEWPTTEGQGDVQIYQDRDESVFGSPWFFEFIQLMRGGERLPIPDASRRWSWQSGRSLSTEVWMGKGLPDEVRADLFRADRPAWVRRSIARELPISEAAARDGLLSDADPEIRWFTLKRTLRTLDEPLGTLLADIAASRERQLKFRTDGLGARREWAYTAAEYQHQVLCVVASHSSTPYTTLLTLMSNASAEVLTSLIENPSVRAGDRIKLIRSMQISKSVTTRELLASLESVPATVLIDMALDSDVRVRTAVAQHPAAPPAALARLSKDRKRAVRLAVLKNTVTPGDLAGSIAESMLPIEVDEDLHEVLNLIEERPDVDVPLTMIEGALDRLSKSRVRDPDMRVVVAEHTRSSAKTLSRLARSTEDAVRQAVAANLRTPSTVLDKLAADFDPGVREKVACNPCSPTVVLEILSHDEDPKVRAQTAENSNIPIGILEILLTDAAVNVRTAALKNPRTPVGFVHEPKAELESAHGRLSPERAVLEEMVASRRAEVRMEVAFSPAADGDLLALLGGERRSAQVRRAVAANPNTPVAVLWSLANDKDDQVRQAVAFNGATSATLLAKLAGHSIDLAILVATNPDVPNTVLDALVQDSNPLIRFVATGHRQSRRNSPSGGTP